MKSFICLLSALVLSIILSSCATVFNSKYQKVEILAAPGDTVYINEQLPTRKEGKYKVERKQEGCQLTVKSADYRDVNIALVPYRRGPLHIISLALVYPALFEFGEKAYDYAKVYSIDQPRVKKITPRTNTQRYIDLDDVEIKLDQSKIKVRRFPNYHSYYKKRDKREATSYFIRKDLGVGEDGLYDLFSQELVKTQFIDTTDRLFVINNMNSLKFKVTVDGITMHDVSDYFISKFMYIDLSLKFELLDYYNKPLFAMDTVVSSGEFFYSKSENDLAICVKDAAMTGLSMFVESPQCQEFLLLPDTDHLALFDQPIILKKSNNGVKDLQQAIQSSVTVETKNGFGSGFIISTDGYVVTNYHVVTDTTSIFVSLNDKTKHKAKLVRINPDYDLALLKIDIDSLVPFTMSQSKDVPIAAEIFAVGTPSSFDLSQTISRGIISGLRDLGISKLIQTDASINRGNSGGPMVMRNGEVIGVVASKIIGVGLEGMAFAIPSYEVFEQLQIKYE